VNLAATRRAVVDETNRERARHGLDPLKPSTALDHAAQEHADDMSARGYFSHDTKGGPSWAVRIGRHYERAGRAIAENIAFGQRNAREVVRAWMNSPGHRRNILDADMTRMGVGFAKKGRRWVQDFGSD
jgi:uncharacterized protein YkwD